MLAANIFGMKQRPVGASYPQWSFDITTFSMGTTMELPGTTMTAMRGIAFSDDGSYFFGLDSTDNKLYRYDLSTPYDITTGPTTPSQTHTPGNDADYGTSFTVGLTFSADGHYSIISNSAGSLGIWHYATAWDIRSDGGNRTYMGKFGTGLSSNLYGNAINPDGNRLYYVDLFNDELYQVDLSTPYDPTTAGTPSSPVSMANDPRMLSFSPDGLTFITNNRGNDVIRQYTMSTAWDVTTATYDSNFNYSANVAESRGSCFRQDGSVLYIASIADEVLPITQTPA